MPGRTLRPAQPFDFAIAAHAHDLVPPDGNCLFDAPFVGRGVHLAVEHDEVDCAVVALGASDDSGNDRRRDDDCHDDAGQALRHGLGF
jgi:hypothetical protein